MAELGPKAGRRIAAGALIAVGILVGLITILLMFSHITSYGVDCGTVLSPKNDPPPNSNPLAGCGGAPSFGRCSSPQASFSPWAASSEGLSCADETVERAARQVAPRRTSWTLSAE